MKITYKFSSKIWQHEGKGGWHFVSLPQDLSTEIRETFQAEEEGWGRVKVTVQIGKSECKTAICFNAKSNVYMLPIKAEIRKKEKIAANQTIDVSIFI